MTPAELFPEIRPWVENLVNVWPAPVIKPQFASWQVLHLLSLSVLGGATILLNLRLIGVGLTDESPSEVHRSLRLWLNLGVVGMIASGVLIGMANAERLYDSAAFTVKMLGLLAAVIFTYGVSKPAAKADGAVGRGAGVAALAALTVWAVGLWVFATTQLINPGMFHVLTAGALIVGLVLRGRQRWAYIAGLALLLAVQTVWTHGFIDAEDLARLDPVNKAFAWIFGLYVLGFALLPVLRRTRESRPAAALVGYAGILMWVSVAAAGRWIAFA
jgi:hypothetical protein